MALIKFWGLGYDIIQLLDWFFLPGNHLRFCYFTDINQPIIWALKKLDIL